MNNKFDELTKSMSQSVTRRGALKKFGVGLAGMALTCFGLVNKAEAGTKACRTKCMGPCVDGYVAQGYEKGYATVMCQGVCALACLRI